MGGLTEFTKWLTLYLDYLEARGIGEKTRKTHGWVLPQVQNEWTDVISADEEFLLALAWEHIKNGQTRKKYNQAIKWFKSFQRWMVREGFNEFKAWLLSQGYSESTAREYFYILKAPAERINRSEKEQKRWQNARKAFKRWIAFIFRPAV